MFSKTYMTVFSTVANGVMVIVKIKEGIMKMGLKKKGGR